MKKIIVNKKDSGKKLNKVILEKVPGIKYSTFCKLLRKKDIKINGVRTNRDINVFENDEILIYIPDEKLQIKVEIEKVYEDENILIINKKAGIEVTGENSLTNILKKEYENTKYKIEPCHRIDRNTTGLVIFAKKEE